MLETLRAYLSNEFETEVDVVGGDAARRLGPDSAVLRFDFGGAPRSATVAGELLRDAPGKIRQWIDDGSIADTIAEHQHVCITSEGPVPADNPPA